MSVSRMTSLAIHGALALFVVGAHMACGGGNATAPASSTAASQNSDPKKDSNGDKHEVATGNTLTDFQKTQLLGHYSTPDGASGFILDRTVTPWRAKLDGVAKTVTLTESNEPRRGEKEYKSEDKSIWLRVDVEHGRVLLFQGPKQHEGVSVVRDADAEQLK